MWVTEMRVDRMRDVLYICRVLSVYMWLDFIISLRVTMDLLQLVMKQDVCVCVSTYAESVQVGIVSLLHSFNKLLKNINLYTTLYIIIQRISYS